MITFEDQERLDAYVRRVMSAQLEVNERSALNSVDMIAAAHGLQQAAIDAIRIAVRVVYATQRASLVLPLPVVPKSTGL